ncbi:MAG TPA: HHHH-motif protein [Burkholderiaceae bacterium]|jgi:hypothetical protein
MTLKKLTAAALLAFSGLALLAPTVASAAPHRHKVCHMDRHHHRVCHWVR